MFRKLRRCKFLFIAFVLKKTFKNDQLQLHVHFHTDRPHVHYKEHSVKIKYFSKYFNYNMFLSSKRLVLCQN
uniref:Uncharacterized protein n=1 Tax=Anguilla anguilla TaxID=7936 RepID=A0A0E9WT56_ANGAN